jgi:hypothetical protein
VAQPQTTQRQYNKLNTLESAIVNAEDSAEDARWQQASIVVALLDNGATVRGIAAEWYNGRTGKPYNKSHVNDVAQVWRRFGLSVETDKRLDWTTAYYTVQQRAEEVIEPEQRKQEWSDAHEARVPKSERTAEKFVENLRNAPPQVIETIAQGAREVAEDRYVEPVERERRRKEAETFARGVTEPIVDAFSRSNVLLHLEQALEDLQEIGSIDSATHDRGLMLLDQLRTEFEVKRAMEGVR